MSNPSIVQSCADVQAKPIKCFTVENEDMTLVVYADTKMSSDNGVGFWRAGELVLQVFGRKRILDDKGNHA